jgi:hypothetical protein
VNPLLTVDVYIMSWVVLVVDRSEAACEGKSARCAEISLACSLRLSSPLLFATLCACDRGTSPLCPVGLGKRQRLWTTAARRALGG